MAHDAVPRAPETAALNDELYSADPGQKITYPVTIDDTGVFIEPTDDDSIQVVGFENPGQVPSASNDTYAVTGIYKKYIVGVHNDSKYLVLQDVLRITPITDHEPESGEKSDSTEEAPEADQEKTNTTSKRPTLNSGKRVTTEGGDERITGKNPFADPERLKETGIHQGGN
jgi:hypothetical protein